MANVRTNDEYDTDDTSGLDNDIELSYDNNIGLMSDEEVQQFLDDFYGVDPEDTGL